jgi:hypothetical protein
MADAPLVRRVAPRDLRQMFAAGDYARRADEGRLRRQLRADRHPSSPKAPVPYCTRSQILAYLDHDRVVAVVHRYLQPDGTLGASGQEDPKRLEINGVVYLPTLP